VREDTPAEKSVPEPKSQFESTRTKIFDFLSDSLSIHTNHRSTALQSSDALLTNQIYPFIIALVPAHNESLRIKATIDSLLSQSRPPDEIIVIADNCTDDTAAVAATLGASVVESRDNADKKAGALNQVLEGLLPLLEETDAILVMDSDTVLGKEFIRTSLKALFTPVHGKKVVGGVGGIFLPLPERWSFAVQFQTNEYIRYQRRLSRRRGRALVLTGTGTLFNIRALRAVVDGRRSGTLPDTGGSGFVYDTGSLTEDNELTLCVKQLGFRVLSPKECTVETAIMPTLRSLYRQRRRWQRGALENIFAHGLNKNTFPYFLRQILTYLGVLFVPLYLIVLTVCLITGKSIPWTAALWVTTSVVYVFEQTWSVRKGGWRCVIFSLLIFPEIFYNFFLDYLYFVSFEGFLYGSTETWGRIRDGKNLDLRAIQAREIRNNRKKVDSRQGKRARAIEVIIELIRDVSCAIVLTTPFYDVAIAWKLISVYVLIGFGATILRLIPVRMT
jgi:cellulose synthase/poly-beta-1,6-N-acetylglucosamine synthase-like glycosyltransferase